MRVFRVPKIDLVLDALGASPVLKLGLGQQHGERIPVGVR